MRPVHQVQLCIARWYCRDVIEEDLVRAEEDRRASEGVCCQMRAGVEEVREVDRVVR